VEERFDGNNSKKTPSLSALWQPSCPKLETKVENKQVWYFEKEEV